MRNCLLALVACSCLSSLGETPKDQCILTMYISGVECPACISMVKLSVDEIKGVSEMKIEQRLEGVANVTFDPKFTTVHQVAQAVTDAVAIHGKPYEARMELKIPAYTNHKSAVDAVFARFKQWVELNVMDAAKGEFTLFFLPLEKGQKGIDHVKFNDALKQVTPFTFVFEIADGF